MHYDEWAPPAACASRVVCCWSLEGDDDAAPPRDATPIADDAGATDADPALPDGCPELLFNFGDPFEHVAPDGTVKRQPSCFLVGVITRPFDVRPTGRVELLAVRFECCALGGLHHDPAALVDRWVNAAQLRDPAIAALHTTLAPLSPSARREMLAAWLVEHAAHAPLPDAIVAGAVRALRTATEPVTIDAVAEQLDVPLRTLQRRFVAQVGVPPKLFARIVRFHRVCLAWRHDPTTLARVAADCGYCDESHLVRDFRAFVGEPPAAFLQALPAFTAHFLSAPR
jgi:AraC-like DNA-binding protein